MNTLKIAVIGAGYLGRHHARVCSEIEGVELTGVADIDRQAAETTAGKYGAKAYLDYREAIGEADAVSIVAPTAAHFAIALDCLRAGKDVLVEKPITATVSEADELIAEAGRTGRILQVGHLERYNPGFVALNGMIKEPKLIEAKRFSPVIDRCRDVDVTVDLMIHDIDVVLSMLRSPIRNLQAAGFSLATEKIDEARVWVEFENGSAAIFSASRLSPEKSRKLKVFQKDSCVELDYQTGVVEIYSASNNWRPEVIKTEYREPLKEEIKDFVRCVETRENPKVSGVEGRNALAVALEVNTVLMRRL